MAGINDLLARMQELADANELTEESLRGLLESSDNASDGLQKFEDVAKNAAVGVNNFGKQIAAGNTSLSGMNGAITGLMDAVGDTIPYVGGLVKGFGKAVTFAIDRLDATHEAFLSLADAGLIGAEGISGLRDDFAEARIPLETYSKMLTNNAEDLASINSSALSGSDQFAKTMKIMNDESHNQLRTLGFSIEEIGKTVVDFQKLQRRIGFSQEMDAQQLSKAATLYGEELDMLSKLTGQSNDKIRKERDIALANTKFLAFVSQLSPKEAEKAMAMNTLMAKQGAAAQAEFQTSVAGSISDTIGQQAAIKQTAQIFMGLGQKFRDGTSTFEDMEQTFNKSREASESWFKIIAPTAQYSKEAGDVAGELKDTAEAMKAKNIEAGTINDAYMQQQKQREDDLITESVNYKKQMQAATATLDKAMLELIPAEKIVGAFTSTLEAATGALRSALGLGELDVSEAGGYEEYEDALTTVSDTENDISKLQEAITEAEKAGDKEVVKFYKGRLDDKEAELNQAKDDVKYYRTNEDAIRIKLNNQIERLSKEEDTKVKEIKLDADDIDFGKMLPDYFGDGIEERAVLRKSDKSNELIQIQKDLLNAKNELKKMNSPEETLRRNRENSTPLNRQPSQQNNKPDNTSNEAFLKAQEEFQKNVEIQNNKTIPEPTLSPIAEKAMIALEQLNADNKILVTNIQDLASNNASAEILVPLNEVWEKNNKEAERLIDIIASQNNPKEDKTTEKQVVVVKPEEPVAKPEEPVAKPVNPVTGSAPTEPKITKPSDKEFEVKSTAVSEEKALQWELEMLKEAVEAKKQNSSMLEELKESNKILIEVVSNISDGNKKTTEITDAINSQTMVGAN